MREDKIEWPDAWSPRKSAVHVVNCISTARPPDAVWRKLIRAAEWPAWYFNARGVSIMGGGVDLRAGAVFHWTTFGVRLRTEVVEFEPPHRVAWLAKGPGLGAYHAWLITPTAAGGSNILTEETQKGPFARLGALIFPGRMERWHQRWLEGLAQ